MPVSMLTDEVPLEHDSSSFDYNVNDPVMVRESEPRVPEKASSEDALLGSFIEFDNPNAQQLEDILKEYQTLGSSPVIEGIRNRSAREANEREIAKQFDEFTTTEQSVQQLEQQLAQTPAKTEDDILDLHQEMLRAVLYRNQAQTTEDQIIANNKIRDLVKEGYPVNLAIQERLDWLKAKFDPSVLNVTVGILADILPFTTTVPFVKAFNKVFPEANANLMQLPRGQLAKELRRRLEAMESGERLQVASDFMDAIAATDSSLSGQDFQKLMIFQEALEGEFTTFDQVIGNAISILDGIGLGGVAKSIFKLFKPSFLFGSPVSTLNIASPKAAGKLASEAIKKDMKPSVGMSPSEIIEVTAVPSKWKSNLELLPPNVAKELEAAIKLTDNLLERTKSNPLATTAAEKNQSVTEIRSQMNQVGNNGLYPSNFTTRRTEDGVDFTAMYGVVDSKGDTNPFKTALDALENAAHQFPDARNIVVYERTTKGQLVLAKPGKTKFKKSTKVGEFVYEVQGSKTYANIMNKSDKIFFEDGQIINAAPGLKYFLDAPARFGKWMSGAFAQAGDQSRGVTHELNKLAEPFTKISNKKKREVVRLLDRYAKNSDTMDTRAIIEAAGRDPDILAGFFSYRQTMDALWHLENRNLRNDLLLQNAKHITIGEFQGIGVKVPSATVLSKVGKSTDETVEVYDAVKKEIVTLDSVQVNKLYTDGSSLYRVKEPVGDLSRQTDLVITSGAKDVRQLPPVVLKKIDGYITRYYKDAYFIRRIEAGTLNGKAAQNFQILRVVGDKAEANQVVQQLVSEGKLTKEQGKRAIVHDRSMSPREKELANQQDHISMGRMFYHPRATTRLQGLDGLADIADPIEAMTRNIDSTSRYVSNFDLLSTMKKRWMNTFGKKYGLVDSDASFPEALSQIGKRFTGTGSEKLQAVESWEHVRRAESISTWEGEQWRNGWLTLIDGFIGESAANTILGKTKQFMAKPTNFLKENSPNRLLRSLGFLYLIVASPFRQAYIQSRQWLFISALAPEIAPKIILQNKAVMIGLLRDAFPEVYKTTRNLNAKIMGMSTKEYDDFITGFNQTGIPFSIDSHDYVANALVAFSKNLNGNILQRAVDAGFSLAATPFRIAKKVGFDYGERSNLINSFLIARQRFLKANKGKKQLTTKEDFQLVAADTRNIALDMTRSGAFRYQDGALSALTQFLAIQHKGILAVLPFGRVKGTGFGSSLNRVGNQSFTLQERRKLLVGQLVLNGATGLGLLEMYRQAKAHYGVELPEFVDDFVVGGMYETVINESLGLLTGEDTHLNISASVSPISGINQKAGDFAEVLMGHKDLTDVVASASVVNRFYDAAKTIQAMYQHKSLQSDDDIMQAMSIFGTVTSGWNQYIRARAAARLGVHVTNSGSPTVQASWTSIIAEGSLGIQQHTTEEFYTLQDQISNELQTTGLPFDEDRETSDVAKELYKRMSTIVTNFRDEFDADLANLDIPELEKLHQQRMREALSMHSSILAIYDPITRDKIWLKFQEKAIQDRTAGRKNLIDSIIKKVFTGDVVRGAQALINRLRASELYDKDSPEGQEIEYNINVIMDSLEMRQDLSDDNKRRIQEVFSGKD